MHYYCELTTQTFHYVLFTKSNVSDLINTELNPELQYNTLEMEIIIARNAPQMNEEQRNIYDRIMLAISTGQGGFFFF